MENLFNSFIDLASSYNKVHPLAAIWLDHPIIKDNGKSCRIESGDKIRLQGEQIINIEGNHKATHKVVECRGNIASSVLKMDLEDLETGELLTLNLK